MDESRVPKICLITLGCAKNEVDSRNMKELIRDAGYVFVDDPSESDATIINTCCFIQEATEESIDTIFSVSGLENFDQGEAKLIISGCMPSRFGDDLEDELVEADGFVPCSKEESIVEKLDGLFEFMPRMRAGYLDSHGNLIKPLEHPIEEEPSPAAYVKVSDGCDHFCAFCAIPYIRGRYHSFTYESIREDVAKQIQHGAREITLIAQDTGRWGTDFPEPDTTAHLMDRLAHEFSDTWFRLMYVEPEGINDQLLNVIRDNPNVCKYIDMPLQHASSRILDSMNRTGSGEEFLNLIAHIRSVIPDVVLRTTLIVGFPGETEEDFDELLDFISEAELDYVGVFPYSREEGTAAAEMDDQVDEETKVSRAQVVRDLADGISMSLVSSRIGSVMPVLVLGTEEDGQLYGRAMCQAPDVDGVTYLDGGKPGDVLALRISDTLAYEMEGDILG